MINYIYKNKNYIHDKNLKKFNRGCWICVEDPTEIEINELSLEYKLERDLLTDALDMYEVPRIEREGDATYIFTRYSDKSTLKVETFPVLIIITPNFFATVSKNKLPFVDKLTASSDFFSTKKTKLLIQLLLAVTSDYKRHVNAINRGVNNIKMNLERIDNKEILQFVEYERILNDFLAALIPTNMILENILSGKYVPLYHEDEDLIEDVSLSTEQLIDMSKSTLKHIVNVREAYTTIMSNNLNKTMKFLTTMTIVLTIPTIIVGFFGMNVALPFQNNPMASLIVVFFTAVLCAALLLVFIKNKIL